MCYVFMYIYIYVIICTVRMCASFSYAPCLRTVLNDLIWARCSCFAQHAARSRVRVRQVDNAKLVLHAETRTKILQRDNETQSARIPSHAPILPPPGAHALLTSSCACERPATRHDTLQKTLAQDGCQRSSGLLDPLARVSSTFKKNHVYPTAHNM